MMGNPGPSSDQPGALNRNRQIITGLVRWRASLGLSQAEVARRMQTSQSAVRRLESGQHNPRLSTLARYAEAIGLPPDFAESPETPAGSLGRLHSEAPDAFPPGQESLQGAVSSPAPSPLNGPGAKPEQRTPWVVIETTGNHDPDHVLTGRQRKILQFIEDCTQSQGYAPTFREIAEAVGLSSASSVSFQLSTLERRGYLRRAAGRSRAVGVRPVVSRPERESGSGAACDAMVGRADIASQATVPVELLGRIAAGPPVLAEKHVEDVLFVPRQLVHGEGLFALRVSGDSMTGAGIMDGDVVVVRRHSTPENGDIVAADIDGEATVKTFKRIDAHIWLMPHNPAYPPILGDTAEIVGKVVAVLRGGF